MIGTLIRVKSSQGALVGIIQGGDDNTIVLNSPGDDNIYSLVIGNNGVSKIIQKTDKVKICLINPVELKSFFEFINTHPQLPERTKKLITEQSKKLIDGTRTNQIKLMNRGYRMFPDQKQQVFDYLTKGSPVGNFTIPVANKLKHKRPMNINASPSGETSGTPPTRAALRRMVRSAKEQANIKRR